VGSDQTVFGPTGASSYWSASTFAASPSLARYSNVFDVGSVNRDFEGNGARVRAVRSGLWSIIRVFDILTLRFRGRRLGPAGATVFSHVRHGWNATGPITRNARPKTKRTTVGSSTAVTV